MKIATYNINGVKARLPRLKEWLAETRPSVACLQEIKSQDEGFPAGELEELGYHVLTHGQKAFNGVAILTDREAGYEPPSEVQRGLGIDGPKEGEGEQARYLEVDVTKAGNAPTRIVCIYLPNGNPHPGPKFDYKLGVSVRQVDAHNPGRKPPACNRISGQDGEASRPHGNDLVRGSAGGGGRRLQRHP